jgi:hypothetical protein
MYKGVAELARSKHSLGKAAGSEGCEAYFEYVEWPD